MVTTLHGKQKYVEIEIAAKSLDHAGPRSQPQDPVEPSFSQVKVVSRFPAFSM